MGVKSKRFFEIGAGIRLTRVGADATRADGRAVRTSTGTTRVRTVCGEITPETNDFHCVV